ncbi:MAG: DUF4406 domain-containing protein [Candidatus Izemoplasmatales bacterium]|nr:DUF4406 domain-containing protein [Candidatus Izemoplasmatales bacterium]
MKKLYISQPMKGKTDEEILEVRERAIKRATEYIGEEVEVIESFIQGVPAESKPLWYLSQSLALMSTADVVYFAEGWKDARGCLIENMCAHQYEMDLIVEKDEAC